MWLLFGAGSKKKPVKGGLRADGWCVKCEANRTFLECEIADKVDVFFVSVVETKTRRLCCEECGDDVDMPAATAAAPPVAAAARKPALETAPRRALSEKEKDKLLAELKKKMSK